MSDVITANTYNGDTNNRHLALTGTGTRQALMDIGSTWTTLRFQYRLMMLGVNQAQAGSLAEPTTAHELFIGVCAPGKEYSSASSQAFGLLLGGMQWHDSQATSWRPGIVALKRVNTTKTPENYDYIYLARGNDALGVPMWSWTITKGDPTWDSTQTHYNSAAPVNTEAGKDQSYSQTSSLGSAATVQRVFIDDQFATSHTTISLNKTVAMPDEAANGYMTCLNIDWNIDADYTMILQDLMVIREE